MTMNAIGQRWRTLAALAAAMVLAPAIGRAADGDAAAMASRIRAAEHDHSEVIPMAHWLIDVYGPRLTGSPNAEAAGRHALEAMAAWGLRDGRLDPWTFGHDGWTNLSASGFIVSPISAQLGLRVTAWTPGTHSVLSGRTVVIDPPSRTTRGALESDLAAVRPKLRGKIVLVGKGDAVPPDEPLPERLDDDTLREILTPRPPASAAPPEGPAQLTGDQRDAAIDAFLLSAGALMRVDDPARPHGMIQAFANPSYDVRKSPPGVVLRHEDYARIVRLIADGRPVTLSFDVKNRTWPAGRTAYNVVADIPGSDLKTETVVIGAHLDSWHAGAGATDDAVGCAIMMEAMRLLTSLNLHPRRTIRIVLWTGEEQGLYGSQAYVAEHFGTAEAPKPGFEKLSAYINIDGGTGRIRAANVFGPPDAAVQLKVALAPFADIGIVGTVAHSSRKLGSTDATTFSRAGLTSIGLIQDPIEYGTVTEHSDLDTFEAIHEQDARDAAVVVAGLAFALANRDAPLSHFPPQEMPAPRGPAPDAHAADRAPNP